MIKKRSLILLAVSLVMSLVVVSVVSAGIYFSELNSKYNLGEIVELNINVDPVEPGYLVKSSLICQGDEIIVFNGLPDETGVVNVRLPLNSHTIKEVSGDCYFSSEYSGDVRESGKFEISKRLEVKLNSESFFVNPGEEVVISGKAERLNGALVNGEVEINIPLLSLLSEQILASQTAETEVGEEVVEESEEVEAESSEDVVEESEETEEVVEESSEVSFNAGKFYGKVENGVFSLSIKLSGDAPAGDYRIDVLVYEESLGEKGSEGSTIANLKVFQIPRTMDLALNNQNFDPGTNLEVKPGLLDQTGMNIDEEVSVIIRGEDGLRLFEKIVQSQENVVFNIPTNLSSGYYKVEVYSGDVSSSGNFFVNEKQIVSFVLVNESLIVNNIGNVPYNKDIEVELNGKPFVKKVELGLGDVKNFKLSGTDGEYNIRISDGDSELSQSGVALTGFSIGVDEEGQGGFVSTSFLWIFVIIGLLVGLFFLFRLVFKKKSFAFSNKRKKDTVEIEKDVRKIEEIKQKRDVNPKALVNTGEAEQVLVLKGHKNNAAVVAVKIKNKIGSVEKNSLEGAIEHVYQKKGAVYEQGDFIFIIFSPLMTHTQKNEVEAAKAAEKISLALKEHNKKFKDKIDFGIGINSGQMINKVEDRKLKFTALGNFIVVAKRLAESSDKQVLVTKESYERGISDIKVEKKSVAGGEIYELRRVVDKEKNEKFIGDFLKRMEGGNNKDR